MDVSGKDVDLVSDLGRCHENVMAMLRSSEPGLLARIGGSDTDIVIEHFDLVARVGRPTANEIIESKFDIVRRYNGYYDKENDPTKVERFCELSASAYRACNHLLVVGSSLLSEFMPETINPEFLVDTSASSGAFRAFFGEIGRRQKPARFYPYAYVENILHGEHTLFKTFGQTLPGQKVLAITPFGASIEANFARRHSFFPNFAYPEFDLRTYNTPITYEGLPPEFYPDLDWFETLARMKEEVGALDFDVALLACGSYALPLSVHIRDVLKRKAIYVGGCLQLFFGVIGRRYENPWFLDQINADAFIKPVEAERYLSHVAVPPDAPAEAFGAYF